MTKKIEELYKKLNNFLSLIRATELSNPIVDDNKYDELKRYT